MNFISEISESGLIHPKIVHIMTGGQIGGAEKSIQWLSQNFDRDNFDYYFIFLYFGGPIHDSILAHNYPVYLLNWKNGNSLSGRLRLFSLLRKIDPDVIHTHDNTPFSRVWMKGATNCPIIFTRHGDLDNIPRGVKYLFTRLDDRFTDLVLANSDFTASIHNTIMGRPTTRTRTIYLGLDLTKYEKYIEKETLNNRNVSSDKKTTIVFIGRLIEGKGIMHLPLLAQELHVRGTDSFTISVIGDGPDKNRCVDYVNELGYGKNFVFWGWQENVIPHLLEADVLVFPSLLQEGFGLVPLEAIALGVPVISYAAGGVVEVLKDAPSSRIVLNIEEMASAIVDMTKRKKPDIQEGLNYVRKKFDIKHTAQQIEDIYSELISG